MGFLLCRYAGLAPSPGWHLLSWSWLFSLSAAPPPSRDRSAYKVVWRSRPMGMIRDWGAARVVIGLCDEIDQAWKVVGWVLSNCGNKKDRQVGCWRFRFTEKKAKLEKCYSIKPSCMTMITRRDSRSKVQQGKSPHTPMFSAPFQAASYRRNKMQQWQGPWPAISVSCSKRVCVCGFETRGIRRKGNKNP
jgi:hypothetical protein